MLQWMTKETIDGKRAGFYSKIEELPPHHGPGNPDTSSFGMKTLNRDFGIDETLY